MPLRSATTLAAAAASAVAAVRVAAVPAAAREAVVPVAAARVVADRLVTWSTSLVLVIRPSLFLSTLVGHQNRCQNR